MQTLSALSADNADNVCIVCNNADSQSALLPYAENFSVMKKITL